MYFAVWPLLPTNHSILESSQIRGNKNASKKQASQIKAINLSAGKYLLRAHFLTLMMVTDMLVGDEETQDLIDWLEVENPCTADELAMVDDNLAVCANLSDDQWEENICC